MRRNILHFIAVFCIYLIINITLVQAFSITYDPSKDINMTERNAVINWQTDDSSDSQVSYGMTKQLGNSEKNNSLVTNHSMTISNLLPNKLYYYIITSKNQSGVYATADNDTNFYSFTTRADITPPFLNVSLPQYYNNNWLGFTGTTEPDSIIRLYLNKDPSVAGTSQYDYLASSDSAGIFVFPRVNLPQTVNTLIMWVQDSSGNTFTQMAVVEVDMQKPNISMNITTSGFNISRNVLPAIWPTSTLDIQGKSNEPVNITYTVNNNTQSISTVVNAGGSNESNAEENTGEESNSTGNSTNSTGNSTNSTANATGNGTISPTNEFTFSITLTENQINLVSISFTDRANNVVRYESLITVDPNPPQLTTNLRELDPSYSQNINIKGSAGKPHVDILIFVNNKTRSLDSWSTSFRDMAIHYGGLLTGVFDDDYATTTGSDNKFEQTVFLTQDIVSGTVPYDVVTPSSTDATYPQPANPDVGAQIPNRAFGIPVSWDNTIRIIARDDFGRTAEETGVVKFQKCGIGGDWTVEVSEVTPSAITPEHLAQNGLAELAFSINLKWKGPGQDTGQTQTTTYTGYYGQNPTTTGTTSTSATQNRIAPQVTGLSAIIYHLSDDQRKHFAIDPEQLAGGVNVAPDPNTMRTFFISIPLNKVDYTQKKWEDLMKNFNKENFEIMVPVEITIPYTYTDDRGNVVSRTQKQCVDVRTMLDVKIPASVIPEWLLKDSIQAIDNTVKAIDAILQPLKTITFVIMGTCLLSWVVYFVTLAIKRYSCMGSKGDSSECKTAMENVEKTKLSMHWICDRVFCPSVPMINKYIKDTGVESASGVLSDSKSVMCIKSDANNLNYIKNLKGSPATNIEESVKKIVQCNTGQGNPTSAECCGQRYMNDWDTACVGMQSELDESKCLLATETGNEGLSQLAPCKNELQSMLRKWGLSSICSADTSGDQTGQKVITNQEGSICKDEKKGNWYYCSVTTTGTEQTAGIDYGKPKSERNPQCPGYIGPYDDGRMAYVVPRDERGAYTKSITVYIPGKGEFKLMEGGSCMSEKKSLPGCAIDSSSGVIFIVDKKTPLQGALNIPNANPAYAECNKKQKDAPKEMQADYKSMQREYVINPSENLKSSVLCVCLPGINGNLILWRNILVEVRNCLEAILVTGDGSPGICKATLSMYVCDVLFKAINCFVERFGGDDRQANVNDMSEPGKFMNAVANAGSDIQSEISGRYGDTGLYNTMFNDRKLINSICLFAFTGEFDFDIEGLVTGGGALPIETKVFVYPATRRFMNSDPTKQGLSTFIYHMGVGIAAGSDINYHVYLVCSNAYDCRPQDGFQGAACDCAGKSEQIRDITGYAGGGYLSFGEMVGPNDGDVYVKIEDSPVRFDKVRVVVDPVSGQGGNLQQRIKEFPITMVGDKPPATCKFDVVAGRFGCGFATGSQGYAAFVAWPVLSKVEPYKIGDQLFATATVEKRSPGYDPNNAAQSSPSNQVPFFLVYSIMDGGRKVVEDKIMIPADGTAQYTIPRSPITVSESAMTGPRTTGTYAPALDVNINVITSLLTITATDYVPPAPLAEDFYVRFKAAAQISGGVIANAASAIEICKGQISPAVAGTAKRTFTPSGPCIAPTSNPTVSGNTGVVQFSGVSVSFVVPSSGIAVGSGFVVDYNSPTASTTPTPNQPICDGRESTWQFSIGLYKCKRIDETKPYSFSNCGADYERDPVQAYGRQQLTVLMPVVVCQQAQTTPLCPSEVLVTSTCQCSVSSSTTAGASTTTGTTAAGTTTSTTTGTTASAGQFCHMDPTTGQRSVFQYKACTLDKQVPGSGSTFVQVAEGRDYCGCASDGSMVDCTNMACRQTGQGLRCTS